MISNRRFGAFALTMVAVAGVSSCAGSPGPTTDAPATPAAATPRSPSGDPRLPTGTYSTAELTVDEVVAAGVAAGFEQTAVEAFYHVHEGAPREATLVYTIKLEAGRWTTFASLNGGPNEIGWAGTYKVVDGDTVTATETAAPCDATYQYALKGNQLTLTLEEHNCDGVKAPEEDQIAQTTVYQTAPFTKIG